jgi:hypothetical protein
MNTTSTTPALARASRATDYTLARQLSSPLTKSGNPYTMYDAVLYKVETPVTWYGGMMGLTLTNAI